jgi:hypothetical protein
MQTTHVPARDILDSDKATPAAVKDAGKVRIGGWGPSLPVAGSTPAAVKDAGKVRIGGWGPSLPRKA